MTKAEFIDVPHDELVQRARDILSQERGKPRDVAWAWTFLCALERGESLPHEEKTYRTIHDAREWIIAQGFATADTTDMPAKLSKGVTVCPPDYDIEDRMMVRLSDVANKAKSQRLAWPENQGVQVKATKKPIQRQPLQEELILELICDMGHDPMNLPPYKVGIHGESIKIKIRSEALKNKTVFTSASVFESAWTRLSTQGRIKHPSAPKPHTK